MLTVFMYTFKDCFKGRKLHTQMTTTNMVQKMKLNDHKFVKILNQNSNVDDENGVHSEAVVFVSSFM